MAKPVLGRFNAPQSLAQLTRGRGWNSELVGFLLPFARQDFLYFEDQFLADTLDATYWATAVTAGGAPTAFAQGALEGGSIQGATGTTDNGVSALYFLGTGVFLDAARRPGMEVRFKIDVVTGLQYEIGFSDAKTDEALPGIADIDAPAATNGVTDIAALHLDTDQTLTTLAVGAYGTTDAGASAAIGTFTPTAATYTKHLIQAYANAAYGVVNNDPVNLAAGLAVGPDTAKLMRPSLVFRTRNTTAKVVDVYYVRFWAENSPDA